MAAMKKADIFEFYRRLAEDNPSPETELEYGNDYQLLVALHGSRSMKQAPHGVFGW